LYYIQEDDKPNFIARTFNIIKLEGDKIIIPIGRDEVIEEKKAEKLVQKTKKILDKAISKKIILSQKIQEQEEYKNRLYRYNFDIIEGKWLFEVLACQALDYILEKKKMKKQDTAIAILVNDLSENMLANIRKIAKEYKRVNIVTNHIEKFKKIEKQILEQDGIMITVGNNKKKGIAKTKLILNIDFPSELINQYNIYENAVILNIRGNVRITKKRFNGTSINDYEIKFKETEQFDYDKINKYKNYELYEAQINKKQPFQEIIKQLGKDKVKITQLVGINSKIWKLSKFLKISKKAFLFISNII